MAIFTSVDLMGVVDAFRMLYKTLKPDEKSTINMFRAIDLIVIDKEILEFAHNTIQSDPYISNIFLGMIVAIVDIRKDGYDHPIRVSCSYRYLSSEYKRVSSNLEKATDYELEFKKWVETLPYFEYLIRRKNHDGNC